MTNGFNFKHSLRKCVMCGTQFEAVTQLHKYCDRCGIVARKINAAKASSKLYRKQKE